MSKQNIALYGLNHGEISKHALGRVDVDRLRLAAEEQINWMPMTIGPAMLRPGLGYLGATKSNVPAKLIPFVFATSDTALIELTASFMRVWVDDELLTVPSVSTTVTNGDFSSSAGWTLTASSGAFATITGGVLALAASALGSSAFCERAVTVILADRSVEHRLRLIVDRGPVTFQIGSTSGAEDIFARTNLGVGTHSIAFTPGVATFYPRLSTLGRTTKSIESMQIESSGTLELPAPWLLTDQSNIRYAQSGDIIFVACAGFQPRQLERRNNNSWSIVLYQQTGGPFVGKPEWADNILMSLDANFGTANLDAASAYFDTNKHVQSLIAIDMSGQNRLETIAAASFFNQPIQVSGVNSVDRAFSWTAAGTWVGTLTLQRSIIGPDEGFVEVADETANGTYSFDDSATHANVDAWYRVGFQTGEYTSGSASVTMVYDSGGGRGECRIFAVNTSLQAQVEITDTFEDARFNLNWRPGAWSDDAGWPSSVEFHDGRLFWGGADNIWGSVSDDFTNFDETNVTAAGPIDRTFGYGPFANVNWLMSLQRLIAGRDSSCVSIRSSSFDAPLTPTDFTMKDCSGHGSAAIAPIKVGTSRGIFVDKSGRRVYELAYDVTSGDYKDRDLTRLNLDIGDEGFVDVAVQFQPDTRIYFVRGDGVCAVLTYDSDDEVEAWWRIETASTIGADGVIESVAVLPGSLEDNVYFVVNRFVNGVSVRYLEKMARMDECRGATVNKIADSFIAYSGSPTQHITGLSHLEKEEVCVWGDGVDLGTYTVSGGQIELSSIVSSAVAGLVYEATYQSAKLPYAAQMGSALTQKKKIDHIGLILTDTHYQGLEFGQNFDRMDNLPKVIEGATVSANTIWSEFDAPMISLPGNWQSDARLCLRATAPRPACVNAVVIAITTNERT
jgi:hypothetical protein